MLSKLNDGDPTAFDLASESMRSTHYSLASAFLVEIGAIECETC
jgi:hypothetical protein